VLPILAVDPGKMTGWATWPGPTFGQDEFMAFNERAATYLERANTTLVVCERFTIHPGTMTVSRGDTNWSIETIGVLRWACHRYGHPFELQGASDAKRFASNELLRQIGWWSRGDHSRDATRHLCLALGRHAPAELDSLLLHAAS
jgi:hypothetical protein